MKKTIYTLTFASFILSRLFIGLPATALELFGISVEITSVAAIGAIAAVLAACALILDFIFKPEIKSNAFAIWLAVLTPLSLIAIPLYAAECKNPLALLGFLIQTVCFGILAARRGRGIATKITGVSKFITRRITR